MFSRFGRALKKKDVGSAVAMGELIRHSYSPSPTIVHLGGPEAVVDWRGLMKDHPYLADQLSGISQCGAFGFTRGADGRCELRTKTNSSDDVWLGPEKGPESSTMYETASLHLFVSCR